MTAFIRIIATLKVFRFSVLLRSFPAMGFYSYNSNLHIKTPEYFYILESAFLYYMILEFTFLSNIVIFYEKRYLEDAGYGTLYCNFNR